MSCACSWSLRLYWSGIAEFEVFRKTTCCRADHHSVAYRPCAVYMSVLNCVKIREFAKWTLCCTSRPTKHGCDQLRVVQPTSRAGVYSNRYSICLLGSIRRLRWLQKHAWGTIEEISCLRWVLRNYDVLLYVDLLPGQYISGPAGIIYRYQPGSASTR